MHRKRMNGRSGPGIVSAKFPRLLTSIGRRGFASKALDYSLALMDCHRFASRLPVFRGPNGWFQAVFYSQRATPQAWALAQAH